MTKLSGPMLAPASGGAPTQVVVLLHGYGSDGADLIGLAPHWQGVLPHALFVSPNAPERCAMLASGYQWFAIDMEGDRLASRQNGVAAARPVLVEFLNDLWTQTGLGPQHTILAGFSQGAMMALHTAFSLCEPLLGVVAFSGAFVPPEEFADPEFARPPVCLVHGDADEVVAPQLSAQAHALLRDAGVPVSYHVSPGVAHGIAPDGLEFATKFIAGLLVK